MRDLLTSDNPFSRASLDVERRDDAVAMVGALRALSRGGAIVVGRRGSGVLYEHCEMLRDLGAVDLSLARLAEGHIDACGILEEAGASAPRDDLYGVWAAESVGASLLASREEGGWRIRGTKRYASGALGLDRALVTARAEDGPRLFDVALRSAGVTPVRGTWPAVGMAASGSLDVAFDVHVLASAEVGGPGFYLGRRGFWHGAVVVAACWLGGALGCARMLRERFARTAPDEHAAAHFGAVVADCHAMGTVLEHAAREIDALSGAEDPRAEERALLVRQTIEQGCQRVLASTGRASGSSPLAFDLAHARRAADLVVYLRQHHAERDLVALSRLTLGAPS